MSMSATPFASAHRFYIKGLYKRILKNELSWIVRRDLWRYRAQEVRAAFEKNRNVRDPRILASILQKAEAELADRLHPDPLIEPNEPGGSKWERNVPPFLDFTVVKGHSEDIGPAKDTSTGPPPHSKGTPTPEAHV